MSFLDTEGRQGTINKVMFVWLMVVTIAVSVIAVKYLALEAEIGVRRAQSNERVRKWEERMRIDSLQREKLDSVLTPTKSSVFQVTMPEAKDVTAISLLLAAIAALTGAIAALWLYIKKRQERADRIEDENRHDGRQSVIVMERLQMTLQHLSERIP